MKYVSGVELEQRTKPGSLDGCPMFAISSLSRPKEAKHISRRRELRRRDEAAATSSMAAIKAGSFAFDGLLNPLIFLTYWSEAARISSGVTGGSKLNSILIFRHMLKTSVHYFNR